MQKSNRDRYHLKHSPGARIPRRIEASVRAASANGRISCKQAHAVSLRQGLPPIDIGKVADLLQIQIVHCQLGLFDHIAAPETKAVGDDIERDIVHFLSNGRLACSDAWRIAEAHAVSRPDIGRACDRLNIKIGSCQLGTF
jgi:hypothetical protein